MKPLLIFVIMIIGSFASASDFIIKNVPSIAKVGAEISPRALFLYMSNDDSPVVRKLKAEKAWIPKDIQRVILTNKRDFLLAVTRFQMDRHWETIHTEGLLSSVSLKNICKCKLNDVERPSANEIEFDSVMRRG